MTSNAQIIDDINRHTMRASVNIYTGFETLGPPEQSAMASVSDRIRGGRILDIGVGGGRTVKALLELSADYIGIDYVDEMVQACRAKFPGTKFEHADARAMPQFADTSFDLIVFAWAGICMVDHAGRIAILKEIRRLLKPGGFFIFSSYNRNSPEYRASFVFPKLELTANPVKLAARALAFAGNLSRSARNRLKFRAHEIRTDEYAIINDKCHDYRTMLYYITLQNQYKQLRQAGFAGDVHAYDNRGQEITADTIDDSITYVVAG